MNGAHIHLILNHIPAIGTLIGAGFLLIGLLTKKDSLIRSGFALFILAALMTLPVFLSGGAAEDIVEHLPGVEERYIHEHEEAAETALIAMIALGVMAIGGLWVFRFMNRLRMTAAIVIFLAAIVAAGWLAYTNNLGGEIRHPEIRQDFVPPQSHNES